MQPDTALFFSGPVKQYTETLAQLEAEIAADAVPAVDDFLDRLTQATRISAEECYRFEDVIGDDEERLREVQCRFREAIRPWFDQSWFMDRAKNKPRGYPGDYETLTGIYNDVPRATGLAGYLDLYFLKTTLAVAVKERLKAARQFLLDEVQRQERPLSFLNVACGPCREYTHGWETGGRPVSVTLIDMDQESLDYVNGRLTADPPAGLTFETRTYNALRMSSADKNVREFGRPDVIYSIGLCDYIPDNYMIRILRGWRESLAPGGVVYVAFKDCNEYDKTEYAWHVDWHFVARTEEDCRRLFIEAGYDESQLEMNRSDSPVIMNFVGRPVDSLADESHLVTAEDQTEAVVLP